MTRSASVVPYLNHESMLTPEELEISKSACKFAQSELAPRVVDDFTQENFGREIMLAMGEQGLLGMCIGEYGCAGASTVAYGLAAREIERVDSGYRSAMSVQSSLVMHPLHKFGSQQQKDEFLPALAKGEMVGCFALTESNAGSDPGSMSTTAAFDGSDYVLNGEKMWITNAPIADLMIVWCKSKCQHTDKSTISGFVVSRDLPGVRVTKIENKLSLRASTTGCIHFDNVRLPASSRLPGGANTISDPFDCLHKARYGIAFGVLGAAEDCFDTARDYASQRRQFGDPLIKRQLIQNKLANMYTDISLSVLGCVHTGRLMDSGVDTKSHVSMLKRRSCEVAIDAALQSRDILGGNGVTTDYSPLRHAINLQTVNTYEGTADIHALILGRHITGMPAFS